MQRLAALSLSLLLAASALPPPEEQTWVTIGGENYGARPDSRGPIGGGQGYESIVARGDRTATDLDLLLAALSSAAPGEVVFLPGDVEIDLTARIIVEDLVLVVPEGVTLASNRGQDGSQGALLFSDALDTPVVIRAGGPGVRVTGLRLRGPNPRRHLEHHRRSFGEGGRGREYYYRFPTQQGIATEHAGLEVDNCEISGFGHAAVMLARGDRHRIHHNFIHHCQYHGLGYGVCHDVASSVIERNLFDWNRHSIAGTGRPGCSYVAMHNVELGNSLSHSFDMHGGRDRQDGTDIAGTAVSIHNNTFHTTRSAVVIRGVPEEGCAIHRNWFVQHEEPGRAVEAGERTTSTDNAYGASPSAAR